MNSNIVQGSACEIRDTVGAEGGLTREDIAHGSSNVHFAGHP